MTTSAPRRLPSRSEVTEATRTPRPPRRGRPVPGWVRYLRPVAAAGIGLILLVVLARWAWDQPAIAAFVARYPGIAGGATHEGTPAWVATLHALNLFFLVQIVRSGLAIRTARRPIGHWAPRAGSRLHGRVRPVTVEQWFHVSLDLLWLACGGVFVVLLFTTGRWVRLVPTSLDVFPNAASVALQYLSLHWPHHDGRSAYNALQMLAYFGVVFLLAPAAALTGLRLSPLWPSGWIASRWFSIEWARAVHFPVMLLFLGFVGCHVGLVAASGPVRALNHMFAARDDDSLIGVLVLAGVLLAAAAAIAASRPLVVRTLAALTGRVTR